MERGRRPSEPNANSPALEMIMGFHVVGAPDDPKADPVEPSLQAILIDPVRGPYKFNKFRLLADFAYTPRAAWVQIDPLHRRRTYVIKAHPSEWSQSTDLASIPWPLWSVLGPYGRQLRPALLHDQLCDEIHQKKDRMGRPELMAERRAADDLFFEALREPGSPAEARMSRLRARLFWIGVSFGRLWDYFRVLSLLAGAHIVLGIWALYTVVWTAAPFVFGGSILSGYAMSALAMPAAVLALSLLLALGWSPIGFGRVVVVAVGVGWLVLPFVGLTFLSALLSQWVVAVAETLTGFRWPRVVGPTRLDNDTS